MGLRLYPPPSPAPSNVQLQWTFCGTSDQCFDLLASGSVDLLPSYWSPGSSYRGQLGRTMVFDASNCVTLNTDYTPYVLANSSINSTAQLLAWMQAGNATLAAQGAGPTGEIR